MRTRPIPMNRALEWVRLTHRRLPKLQGGMWAIAVCDDADEVRGVAVVGRPTARMVPQDGRVLQVLRVAVQEGFPNGCSMLYGRVSRAARAMGADDCLTFIHDDESGVSLKAAGWIGDEGFTSRGGEWSRPSRPRETTVEPGVRRKFLAPWSKSLARSPNPDKEGNNGRPETLDNHSETP